jgi:hypothetical protein
MNQVSKCGFDCALRIQIKKITREQPARFCCLLRFTDARLRKFVRSRNGKQIDSLFEIPKHDSGQRFTVSCRALPEKRSRFRVQTALSEIMAFTAGIFRVCPIGL